MYRVSSQAGLDNITRGSSVPLAVIGFALKRLHTDFLPYSQAVRHGILIPTFVGSSPAGAANFTVEVCCMSFGAALEEVKKGKGMRLPKWSPEVVIRAQYPDEHSKMTHPYLYVESRFGRVPWKETMVELFAEDWQVVD